MKRNYLAGLLVATLLFFSFAGISNWDAIKLTGIGSDTNILEVENSSGTDVLVATEAGAVTMGGTLGVTGDITFTGDANFDGAIDFSATTAVTENAGAYHTQVRVGTGSTPDVAGSIAADGVFVEGAVELDSTVRLDGALDINSSVNYDAATAITETAGAYHTQVRVGTGATPDVAASIAADGVFVEGEVEVDGAIRLDGALDVNSSVDYDAATVVTEAAGSYHTQVRVGTGSTPDVAGSIAADGVFVEGEVELDAGLRLDGDVDVNGGVNYSATSAITETAGAYHTQVRVGTGATPDEAASIAADGVFVEGEVEVDGAIRLDGALDVNSSVNYDAATAITETAGSYHTQVRVGTGSTPDEAASIAADGVFIEGEVEVDGAARFDGTVALNAAVTYAVTKSLWIPVSEMKLPAANPATAGEEDSIGTLEFVDAAADDFAWFTIIPPDDMDTTKTMEMSVYYILPSGTPTEGAWEFLAIGLDDDEAGAVASTALEIIYDLPSAAADWNITTSATVPTSVTTKAIMNFNLGHDVADPFGGTVEVAGVKITYTSIRP